MGTLGETAGTLAENRSGLGRAAVSVILVNWNAGEWIERSILALNAQSCLPLEVIVIDNASSDGSAQRIEEGFPAVRVIQLNENSGFAAANNLGVRLMSDESKWVALLNPDAFPEPSWLESLLTAAENNPDYTVFGCRLMDANTPSKLDGVGDAYHVSGRVWREQHQKKLTASVLEPEEIFSPCAAAAMYRRDVFVAAGGFDEDYFCYVEDVDLGFRVRLLGHRCLYVPQAVVFHVGSAVTGKHSDFSVYHGHRNLVWTFIKNMPGPLLWALLSLHLALNLVTIANFCLRGQSRVILRAKWDAIRGVRKMWRKRLEIQRARVCSVGEIWRVLNKRLLPLARP